MKPLIVLLSAFVITLLISRLKSGSFNWKYAGRIGMSAMLFFTAVAHFVFTEGMAQMIPDLIPFKTAMVYLTGVLEILSAIGLMLPKTYAKTGIALIVFYLAILPANVYAALNHINYQTGELDGNGPVYLWFRIPLQILFIAWVYFFAVRKKEREMGS